MVGLALPYTTVTVFPRSDGAVTVTVAMYKSHPTRRTPILLQKPWEHYYTLPDGVTPEDVFRTLRGAMRDLKMDRPVVPVGEAPGAP